MTTGKSLVPESVGKKRRDPIKRERSSSCTYMKLGFAQTEGLRGEQTTQTDAPARRGEAERKRKNGSNGMPLPLR